MKNFELSRFTRLLKLDVSRNRRQYLHEFLEMWLSFFAIQFVSYYTLFKGVYYTPVQIASAHENIYTAFLIVEFMFAMAFMASSFSFLHDKNRRISYFMLPATHLEKFVSRLIICTLGKFVLSLIAFVLADLLVVGILRFFQNSLISVLPYAFDESIGFFTHGFDMMFDNGRPSYGGWVTIASFLSSSCMTLSLYLLASMVFRKYPFILMSICLITVTVVVSMLTLENINGSFAFIVLRNDGYMAILFTLLTCCFTGLSYWLFKRKGAVNQTFL